MSSLGLRRLLGRCGDGECRQSRTSPGHRGSSDDRSRSNRWRAFRLSSNFHPRVGAEPICRRARLIDGAPNYSGAELCREDLPGFSRTERATGAAALPASVAAQLRAGARVLSARFVHDEVQPGRERRTRGTAWAGGTASGDARAPGARRARIDRADGSCARGNHRHGRRVAASGGRRAGRVDGASDDPRVSSQARRGAAQGDHPGYGARHQSCQLHARGLRGDRREIEPARLSRSC